MQGAVNVCLFLLISPVLERVWGSVRWLLFCVLLSAAVMVSVFALCIALYALTESEVLLFRVVCGLSGVNAGAAMALKQRWPEAPLLPAAPPALPFLQAVQLQHLPLALLTLALLSSCLGWVEAKEAPLVLSGTLLSFLFLRFYSRDAESGQVGDMRPEFAFATICPDVGGLRAVLNLLCTVPFHLAMRAGLVQDALKSSAATGSVAADAGGGSALLDYGRLASLAPVDPLAERRRILAIKAIDEKLAALAKRTTDSGVSAEAAAADSAFGSSSSGLQQLQQPVQADGAHVISMPADERVDGATLPSQEELDRMEREVTAGREEGEAARTAASGHAAAAAAAAAAAEAEEQARAGSLSAAGTDSLP